MISINRTLVIMFMLLIAIIPASAHHGVAWVKDGLINAHGTVIQIDWVQPHPSVLVKIENGDIWRADLARFSKLKRAGLNEDTIHIGDEVDVLGEPSRDDNEKRMHVACIKVDNINYCGYPEKVKGTQANLAKAEWAVSIEKLPFIYALKASLVGYPVVSGIHLFGLAILFTCVMLINLRLLGFFKSIPQQPLTTTLRSIALPAFIIAVVAGLLMAAVRASSYITLTVFWLKLALIVTAVINFFIFTRLLANQGEEISKAKKLSAALSLVLWVSVVACGRALGFV